MDEGRRLLAVPSVHHVELHMFDRHGVLLFVGSPLGKDALVENIRAYVDAVVKAKPPGSKGQYVKRVSISSTMGPGIKLDAASVVPAAAS